MSEDNAQPTDEQSAAADANQQSDARAMEISPQGAPSAVRTQDDLAQVMVDQWGHRGEFVKNQIVRLSELNPDHYDRVHAVRSSTLRLLTEAEARVWAESVSPTSPTTDDGAFDEDNRRATRIGAGIPADVPQTITTGQGPAEPAEFSKSGDQQAARPIVEPEVGSSASSRSSRRRSGDNTEG